MHRVGFNHIGVNRALRQVLGIGDSGGFFLENFDKDLGPLMEEIQDDELLVITADHGNDPTWHGTDHTREQAAVLATGPGIAPKAIGARTSFADMGETLAAHLGLAPGRHGVSFL